MNRKEKKMERRSSQLAREVARVRASMEDAALSSPSPARRSRESSSRLHRTGDDLEGLYNEVAAAPSVRTPAPPKNLPLRGRRGICR